MALKSVRQGFEIRPVMALKSLCHGFEICSALEIGPSTAAASNIQPSSSRQINEYILQFLLQWLHKLYCTVKVWREKKIFWYLLDITNNELPTEL